MPEDNRQLAPVNPSFLGSNFAHGHRAPSVKDLEINEIDAFGQLRAVWDLLLKHQWLILAVAFLLTVLVAVYSYKMKPVYQATARIDVEAELPLLQTLNDIFKTGEADDSFLATQVSIMQSDNLIWDTIQRLGMGGGLDKQADSAQPEGRILGTPPAMKNALVAAFKGRLRVDRIKDTHMLSVSVESTDPTEAANLANALVANYIEYNFRTKYDATRQATGWMEQRLDELKLKVEKSSQAMVDYERQNNIVSFGEKQSVPVARLEDLSKELNNAQTDRLTKESLYKMVASNESQVGFNQANSLLGNLEAKEMDLKEQYSEISAQFGPAHPKAVKIQDQLKDMGSLIARERKRAVESVHHDYLAALQREQVLAVAVADQKTEVEKENQLLIEHNLLKREFDTNQQLYDTLLEHLKDANVSAGLRATNIHSIDQATPPSFPIRPNKVRNVEFALAAGLMLGIGLAFTKEALDNSVKNAMEMEKLLGFPTLAIVPIGQSSALHRSGRSRSPRITPGNGDGIVELSVLNKPGAAISEAFRTLRTSVLLSSAERQPQAILITSSQPNEGKSVTALNLALTLAQKGGRVLLVDSDMRRPTVARTLGMPNKRGLSGILTGAYEYDDTLLLKVDRVESLFVLPSGPHPPNPAELLCSMKMEKLIKQMRERFDNIVFDSPPVLPITDATILSSLVDGVILVVACEATTRAALNRACRVIEHSGGKILGTVLNKVDVRRDGYYGYRYYHGYYTYQYKAYYHDQNG
jgi:capsular exopolysaccharide synthesis family protein